MNVNISAVNNALNFIDSNYKDNEFVNIDMTVNTKEKSRRKREFLIEISLKNNKNSSERTYKLIIERRFKENEKLSADLLYQNLTIPGQEWRKKLKVRVSITNHVSNCIEYSVIQTSCNCGNIDEIRFVLLKIFKIIYSDDNLKTFYVSVRDWREEKVICFDPFSVFEALDSGIGMPEFSLN